MSTKRKGASALKQRVEGVGDGFYPVPRSSFDRSTSSLRGVVKHPPSLQALTNRQRNEPGGLSRFHPHQNGVLACGPGVRKRLAYVADVRNSLAADIEDHIAGLNAMLGGGPIGIYSDHSDALISRTRNFCGRCEREAEMRQTVWRSITSGIGLGLLFVRNLRERQLHGLEVTFVQKRELDAGARRHHPDLAGQIARVLDCCAVDSGDHVAGGNARL
jgi:hypothetical protein